MPDEYLPPNKILFLQNLPETVTKDQLMALFSQYVSSPSLHGSQTFIPLSSQISKPVRSPSHPNKEGYRIRGVLGRAKRYGSERCSSQLQTGWREQNQGKALDNLLIPSPLTTLHARSLSQGSSVPGKGSHSGWFAIAYRRGPCLLTVPSLYSGAHAQCIIRAIRIDSSCGRHPSVHCADMRPSAGPACGEASRIVVRRIGARRTTDISMKYSTLPQERVSCGSNTVR